MPFKFVYFSHEENFHWNDNNWIEQFCVWNASAPQLIFPKPDQSISLNKPDQVEYSSANRLSLDFWRGTHQNLSVKNFVKPVSLDELKSSYVKFNERLKKANSLFQSVVDPQNFFLNLKINDLGTTIRVGLFESSFEVVTILRLLLYHQKQRTFYSANYLHEARLVLMGVFCSITTRRTYSFCSSLFLTRTTLGFILIKYKRYKKRCLGQ